MLKKLKSELLASIRTKRIHVFFLFLFLAFSILILTKLSKFYTNTIPIKVETLNVPDDIVVLNDSTVLEATLKTNGFRWLGYYIGQPKITVDFSKDVYKKDSVFVWHKSAAYVGNTQFNKNVELFNINPDTLFFRFDVNMVKKIPIKLKSKITYSLGYDVLDDYVLQPDSVTVIGAAEIVSKIKSAETEQVILKDAKANINQAVKLKLPKVSESLKFSASSAVLSAQVEKFTEGTLTIPVEVVNIPEGLKIKFFPKKINVTYYVSLSQFNGITETDFKAVCDFNTLIKGQSFLTPKLVKAPKQAKRVSIGNQHVEFIIVK
ncbi:MAG: CdaR family protein [Flavobacteriaceae bacterium]